MKAADLTVELAVLRESLANVRQELSEIKGKLLASEAAVHGLQQEMAVLRQRLDDHLKRVDLWDNRRWGVIGLFIGSVVSLVANLVIALVRKTTS
jgi:hypothetical protein